MARNNSNDNGAGALGFEATLWSAAEKLKGNMDAGEYKHVVLGLIFLKYISDAFEEKHAALAKDKSADAEDRDEYTADNIFWVNKIARWSYLQGRAKQATIGKDLDDAMVAVEKDNPALKGVLPKEYARPALDKHRLGELIDLIGTIGLGDRESRSKDILGRVYEYFLSEFASAEGKLSGQFYTPRHVVRLLIEILAPYKGRVFDPCCGSGGMFVQSERFVESHGGRIGDISIYGQESNYTTWRLAMMNMAIRGIEAHIAWNEQGSFHKDAFKELKADYILANPPFNDDDWGGDRLREDVRWKFGVPPASNANFAWVQHFIHHLAPRGVAGFILGNISLTSETSSEDLIRKGIVDANLVDCIITLPEKLFYSTPIPVGIWILRKNRGAKTPQDKILFIDASKLGKDVSRTHRELTDEDIKTVGETYHRWIECSDDYADKTGFCRSVEISEVITNNYKLLPAAYVNAGHIKAARGMQLREVLQGEVGSNAARSLKQLAELSESFDKAIRRVEGELKTLEKNITFETHELGDLLESSDERLGNAEEPDVLTCTERGGLILQKERFAKRVATDDSSKYKIVRMGDIVYNPYLLWKGSIDQCWIVEIGITSPAYEIFRVRPGFDKTIVGQLVISPEMIKRYDGISFGTVQRRRRAPAENFLKLKVNVPKPEHLEVLSNLLSCSQDCQFASRTAERAVRHLIRNVCAKLR